MTDAEKIAAWDEIAEAWRRYSQLGADVFDWDFDSRPVMERLTGLPVTYWYKSPEQLAADREAG